MPCNVCGNILVNFENKITCPKCLNLKIVKHDIAIQIAQKRINYIRALWKTELNKIHRDSLLVHLLTHREVQARKFIYEPGVVDIDQLFSDTLFIKRVLKEGNPDGALLVDDTKISGPIIELFNETKRVETDYSLIKAEYALMVSHNEFDLSTLSDKDSLEKFSLIQTEDYEKLMKSYGGYNLMTKDEALKKQKENAAEFERILKERPKPEFLTREKFIEKNYDFIRNLYVSLLRSYIYAEVFELRSYKEMIRDPSRLNDFVKHYDYDPWAFTRIKVDEFIRDARKHFKKSRETIEKLLLCDENNSDVFPLFVCVKVGSENLIPLSQIFTYILYLLLHAITTYDLFLNETQKRGRIFEDRVKKRFEDLGFSYLQRVCDNPSKPNMEIDGIASKDGICIVIESKHHGLPVIVESSEAKKFMIEDLQGIVDGKKRVPKDGRHITEDVPSLPQKIEYVKQNLSDLGLSGISTSKVFGLIVTYVYPLLSNYRGIHFSWLDDVSQDKLNELFP